MNNQNALKKNDDILNTEAILINDQEYVPAGGYYGIDQQSYGLGSEKQILFKAFSILRKYWLMIAGLSLLMTLLVIVYVAQRPNYYKAEARVQINTETNPAAGGGKGGGSIVVNNAGNDPVYFATQLQILEGAGLMRRVVKTLDLEHNEAFLRPNKGRELTVWQNVAVMFNLYRPPARTKEPLSETKTKNTLNLKDETRLNDDTEAEKLAPYVSLLKRGLKVSPVKDNRTQTKETRLIEIEFIHQDPVVAAKIVNTIADVYVLQNLEHKVQNNATAGDFLQKRVAELQSQIRLGEERLINYAKNNQIVSLDSNQNTVVQRLGDLNGKLVQAETDKINAEAAYRAALQNPMLNVSAESKDARTAVLETQLTTLSQRLEQLKTEYTEEWPEVIQTRRQIAGIEKELQGTRKRASNTQIAALEQTYREALAKERDLRANFDKQRMEVLEQNEAAINYKIIQQEIDTNKTLLDGLLQRSRENDVILEGTPNNVSVIDRALVPRSAEGSEKFKDIFVAFIASLGLGVGLAFLFDWLNDKVKSSDDLEAKFNLPILAMIPAASGYRRRLLGNKVSLRKQANNYNRYDLASFEKPVMAESYLHLRTYLLLSNPGGPPQKILVTSGQPGEGKTVTAINLAKSLAQTGADVLLIDGDLRCPRLASIFELNNPVGLSNLLTMKEFDWETAAGMIQKEPISNIHILSAGPKCPAPANLLGSNEMRDLLKKLSELFTYIIIDSPPVLYFADSAILSTCVDGVVIVARDNQTSTHIIQRTKKKLSDVNAKVVGMVLNGISKDLPDYYNYAYYESNKDSINKSSQEILKLN